MEKFDFDKIVTGAKFKLVRETLWINYYDPETMGGKYALVADVIIGNEDYSVFVKENGYEISNIAGTIQRFDFEGNLLEVIP